MAGRAGAGQTRAKGNIETLPSGALRVRVYAGRDPVTKKRHNLVETIEPGPKARNKAEAVRDRLLAEVAERRHPRTSATVDQLVERYLDQFDGAPNTLQLYRAYHRNHISPLLGKVRVGALDAEMLDSFYAECRRCRRHCTSRRLIDHRTTGEHECDDRCKPHRCRPLGRSTVRHMHFLLSGAYRKARRWKWVAINPLGEAEPPPAPPPNPQPPTTAETAEILTTAFEEDPDWGTLLWTSTTTGPRRGEVCAVRWTDVALDEPGRDLLWLRQAIRKEYGKLVVATLKTHQQRRVALDPVTAELLREHRARCRARAAALGLELGPNAYVFSLDPDGKTFRNPGSVTQRYDRLVARLGINTCLKWLRAYSVTELIAAGVDIRTVAGRFGHSGGGITTLRVYAAWLAEADQRAAGSLHVRVPELPLRTDASRRTKLRPKHPYEVVAGALMKSVDAGELQPGSLAPSAEELAAVHDVSLSTARRAVALAKEWGVLVGDGRTRPRVSAAWRPGTR